MKSTALACLVVPVCAIIGHEVWVLTANLRYRTAPADHSTTMAAIVHETFGPPSKVLKREVLSQPRQPAAAGFLVIRVVAAALNPVDFKQLRNAQPSVLVPTPRIVGFDVSGVVLSAGEGTPFRIGDRVFGMLPLVGSPWGALAEVTAADARCFAKAPTSISLAEAAALPLVALTVMQVFRQASLVPIESEGGEPHPRLRQRMLVHAAAGGVGSFAVQYARHVLGFGEVVGTCSARNAERVRALGATATVDYLAEPFETAVQAMGGVDAVLDPMAWQYMRRALAPAAGVLRPAAKYCHILSTDWAANAAEASVLTVLDGPLAKWHSRLARLVRRGAPQVFTTPVQPDGEGLAELARMVDNGQVRPVIDRYYDGLDSAAEAFEHLLTGHARGKVVIRIGDPPDADPDPAATPAAV